MKEIKAFYHKIKELLSNKRTRAFTVFGLYSIFIIFVIFFVRGVAVDNRTVKPTPTPPVLDTLTSFGALRNYEIEMNITYPNNSENSLIITGSILNQEKLLKVGDKAYYQKESNMYEEKESLYYLTNEFPFDKLLEPDEIVELINKGVVRSKSEDYETKIITKTISINASEYPNLNTDIYQKDGTITIETCEKENKILKVIFHFEDAYDIKNKKDIIITYQNIGAVKPFEIEIGEFTIPE